MFTPPSGFDLPVSYVQILLWILTALSLVSTVQGFTKKQPDLTFNIMVTLLFAVAAIALPIFNTSGSIAIKYYGIIIMFGAVCGAWLAAREAQRRGYDPEMIWDLLVWLIVGGVVGARLWHVFTPSASGLILDPVTEKMVNPYFAGGTVHILNILDIRNGGLGIPGTIIGGAIALLLYCRRHKLNFAVWADISAPSLALGQSIGRWGNFLNQELYGRPTDLPWKLYVDTSHRLAGFESYDYYHPLFLYESVLNLANMFFLMWVTRQFVGRLRKGDVFLVYLIFYPVCRFFLEFLRLDAAKIGGININQTVMAVVAVTSAALLIWRHRAGAAQPAPAGRSAGTSSVSAAQGNPARRNPRVRPSSKAGRQPAKVARKKGRVSPRKTGR